MSLSCLTCGNEHPSRMRWYEDGTRICNNCGLSDGGGVPDVFWNGKPEENLADDPNTGNPRIFASKGEKAAYLKEKGLMEAGDKVHGAPWSSLYNNRRNDSRAEVLQSLRKVKQMGIDVRRQEYLRIIKEGERYAKKA